MKTVKLSNGTVLTKAQVEEASLRLATQLAVEPTLRRKIDGKFRHFSRDDDFCRIAVEPSMANLRIALGGTAAKLNGQPCALCNKVDLKNLIDELEWLHTNAFDEDGRLVLGMCDL